MTDKGFKSIHVVRQHDKKETMVILNTIRKDPTKSREEALMRIYTLVRPGETPTLEMAEWLIEKLFFNNKRYDLGDVGRYMINQRLGLDIPTSTRRCLIPRILSRSPNI